MSTLSTHVLDTTHGRPATGILVNLEHGDVQVGSGRTDSDGRVRDWHGRDGESSMTGGLRLAPGRYRLTFHVAEYFDSTMTEAFYDVIAVDFRVTDNAAHYHVPLLLSPYGYSTYRGN